MTGQNKAKQSLVKNIIAQTTILKRAIKNFKIVVWAIILLTKLRFPPGISIAIVLKAKQVTVVLKDCVS